MNPKNVSNNILELASNKASSPMLTDPTIPDPGPHSAPPPRMACSLMSTDPKIPDPGPHGTPLLD
jgi:hypothetical protein